VAKKAVSSRKMSLSTSLQAKLKKTSKANNLQHPQRQAPKTVAQFCTKSPRCQA
jgi:hypothetical protein